MLKDEAWDVVNHARRYVRTENQEQAYLSFYAKIDRRVKRAVIAMDPANEAVNGDLVAFLSDNSDHLSSRPCRERGRGRHGRCFRYKHLRTQRRRPARTQTQASRGRSSRPRLRRAARPDWRPMRSRALARAECECDHLGDGSPTLETDLKGVRSA